MKDKDKENVTMWRNNERQRHEEMSDVTCLLRANERKAAESFGRYPGQLPNLKKNIYWGRIKEKKMLANNSYECIFAINKIVETFCSRKSL